ncbi:pyroglutamyl-peptidase I [Maritalea myrionectae]|uniref:Pyroglutamyl-peptidase I n=1 Tax=Maritalea myrionectae TaxID=454601 RepID=A0A2R4MHF4_9HYPH|nr:pyroglutamyl-peptidase I [Maritalea myrionectae]AVX05410.1 pyroglutamyl-peptidase I [Maritalea myrionectae]
MKILLTGFEPFGNEQQNPSEQLAKLLNGARDGDAEIVSAILPVERYAALEKLDELMQQQAPDMVVALGVAVGRAAITPEKVAINFDDFRIPDNAGHQPVGETIFPDGPTAYFSTLPINLMVKEMETQVPSAISFSAGTFVCNHLMYGVLHLCACNYPKTRAGFVHVPQATECLSPTSGEVPHLPLSQMAEALRRAIWRAASHKADDIKLNAGDTH